MEPLKLYHSMQFGTELKKRINGQKWASFTYNATKNNARACTQPNGANVHNAMKYKEDQEIKSRSNRRSWYKSTKGNVMYVECMHSYFIYTTTLSLVSFSCLFSTCTVSNQRSLSFFTRNDTTGYFF